MLSFQRFQRPPEATIQAAPYSLGALPLGADAKSRLYLPLADDEAFWIGVTNSDLARASRLAVRVEVEGASSLDAISGKRWNARAPHRVAVSTFLMIDGLRRAGGGLWVLSRVSAVSRAPACKSIHFMAQAAGGPNWRASASVALVDYAAFQRLTHVAPPSPLDPDAGYKGWRLP